MATYTRSQLVRHILDDLEVTDAMTPASAEDHALVLMRIAQEMERLRDDEGLIPFDIDGDAIPSPYMVPLARVIAPSLAGAFGKLGELDRLLALETRGMKALRRLKAQPHYGSAAPATYY